jgi:membrane-bound serine protease (ClpP class)
MFELCVVLLIIGILALVLELIMPGYDGFIGAVIGALALVTSAILGILFLPNGWWFATISLVTLLLCTFILFKYIRRGQLHGKIVLSDALAEDLPGIDTLSLLGKEGATATKLRPSGEVDFGGTLVEVTTNGQLVERGTVVKVIDVRTNKVIVTPIHSN